MLRVKTQFLWKGVACLEQGKDMGAVTSVSNEQDRGLLPLRQAQQNGRAPPTVCAPTQNPQTLEIQY